jgi:hypothetical protein
MNAVEIETAVSTLASQPFDTTEFPFAFLAAFDNKETTLKRLRKGETNGSDLVGGVLQRNNIHIATCASGQVGETLRALRLSPKTAAAKAKFILATDGETLEAEELATGETVASEYKDLAQHFGFFLPLAGISTIAEIKNDPIDIKATGRLNKLYVELLKENLEWATEARRHDMNHFMARLIFCFFAEDTDIFRGSGTFTSTIDQMSERDGTNTHQVIETLFRAMNIDIPDRASANLPGWADGFPYVNGGLFSGSTNVPRFSRIARSYLLRAGELNWRDINPDIFGSMIQAVADEGERGALGMHYTSVPNILKVLNPLFLDELRAQLEAAGDNPRMLLNLRKRMARIRVFDPACGSGNFLVIAYKEMRAIEAEINRRRDEELNASEIPIENFRGIEVRDFPAEIARLALVIAQFQCDVRYRGPLVARSVFLPLKKENWIICGNALRLDWLSVCPSTGTTVRLVADDLFATPLEQTEIDFANEGGETYICGNPPYLGSTWQQAAHKDDLQQIFEWRTDTWKALDYVAGWFMKAADYGTKTSAVSAFVSTNSICQGQQVPFLWPLIFDTGHEIVFAHTSLKWSNLASHNAGVTVVIVGISNQAQRIRRLYSVTDSGEPISKDVPFINAYLVPSQNVVVEKAMRPLTEVSPMDFGNKADDGGHLTLTPYQLDEMRIDWGIRARFIKQFYGSREFINGETRYCIWIGDEDVDDAMTVPTIARQIELVRQARESSRDAYARSLARRPHSFKTPRIATNHVIVTPRVSSENRAFLPVGVMDGSAVIGDRNFAIYDAPLWNMALIASRLHWVWIATVCVRMRTDFSYSNTLGWNTFPVPALTEQNKAVLTQCAENILFARETHYPATIADLYDPETMPENLRHAHEQNDETLERIYIGRRFRNDTERLEKLFEMYTRMTAAPQLEGKAQPAVKKTRKRAQ